MLFYYKNIYICLCVTELFLFSCSDLLEPGYRCYSLTAVHPRVRHSPLSISAISTGTHNHTTGHLWISKSAKFVLHNIVSIQNSQRHSLQIIKHTFGVCRFMVLSKVDIVWLKIGIFIESVPCRIPKEICLIIWALIVGHRQTDRKMDERIYIEREGRTETDRRTER
jgi:hypothetical protein